MPYLGSWGKSILKMLASRGLIAFTFGATPIFLRPRYIQGIPLKFPWNTKVTKVYTCSDHQFILFRVCQRQQQDCELQHNWRIGRLDKERFSEVIATQLEVVGTGLNSLFSQLKSLFLINTACGSSVSTNGPRHRKRPNYWKAAELAFLRRQWVTQLTRNQAEASAKSKECKVGKNSFVAS